MIRKGITLLKKCFSTAAYSRAMYEAWKKNPKDVHEDWNAVFKNTPVVDTPVHS
jgi:2-oxoglutarate dehydrogenase complex dehydrogenase (E1) component-like enzyme